MTWPTVASPRAWSRPPASTAVATDQVGALDRREPHRPQEQGVALGPVLLADVVVGAADSALLEPQRLHGAAALDRLGDPAGEPRPRRHLAQVAGRGPRRYQRVDTDSSGTTPGTTAP